MNGHEIGGRPVNLRALVPPGRPEPLLGTTAKLTRDERRAQQDHERALQTFKRVHRTDPLPPGVWVIRCERRYQVLRATGPGCVEIWAGGREAPRQIGVRRLRRGWWRGSRLRIFDGEGTSWVIRTVAPGAVGMAELGEEDGLLWTDFASIDILGVITIVVGAVVLVVTAPRQFRQAAARRRIRDDIARAIRGS